MHAWYTPHLGRGIELITAVPRESVVPKNDVEVAVHPRRRSTMATHHGGTCPAPTPASAARSCPPAPGPRNGRCRPRSPAWRSTNQGKSTEANASKSAKSAPKFCGFCKNGINGINGINGKRCHPPPMNTHAAPAQISITGGECARRPRTRPQSGARTPTRPARAPRRAACVAGRAPEE